MGAVLPAVPRGQAVPARRAMALAVRKVAATGIPPTTATRAMTETGQTRPKGAETAGRARATGRSLPAREAPVPNAPARRIRTGTDPVGATRTPIQRANGERREVPTRATGAETPTTPTNAATPKTARAAASRAGAIPTSEAAIRRGSEMATRRTDARVKATAPERATVPGKTRRTKTAVAGGATARVKTIP